MGTEESKLANFCKDSLEPFGVKLGFNVNKTAERGYNGADYPNHNPSLPADLQEACKKGRMKATAKNQSTAQNQGSQSEGIS